MAKRFLSKLIILVYLFLCGCTSHYVVSNELPDSIMQEMNTLYPKWHEISFCVGNSVYNVLEGGITSCPVPICKSGDIMFHTHPVWAENWANSYDKWNWDVYHCVFGNTKFGVMYAKDKVKIYTRKPEYIGVPVFATVEDVDRIREMNRR